MRKPSVNVSYCWKKLIIRPHSFLNQSRKEKWIWCWNLPCPYSRVLSSLLPASQFPLQIKCLAWKVHFKGLHPAPLVTCCSASFLILAGEDERGNEKFPWLCSFPQGDQNAWVTSGDASCRDWPVHLGMSDLELFFRVCVCCWELEGVWGWAQKCLNLAKCDAKWLWARGLGEVVFSLLLSLELPVLHSSLWSCWKLPDPLGLQEGQLRTSTYIVFGQEYPPCAANLAPALVRRALPFRWKMSWRLEQDPR